jgi:uncharacterized protein
MFIACISIKRLHGAKNTMPRPTKADLENGKRIESDIAQFYSNAKEVKKTTENEYALELAAQYCEDTKYFLAKKDYVTAFGCINYAHGLLDAFRKKR